MNVEVVQRRLWERSRQHREHRESDLPLFPVDPYDGRARNLMDLMHQPQWIAAACDRVLGRSRGKAAGVDRVTASEFQQNRRANLEELRLELKRGTYQPQPLRRVMIPKANGKQRGLGIPCIRDKIVQEVIRMALEPIYEVEFHANSYGFRPNRSTHHAVSRCQQMTQKGFTWVIEGDVKACFDEISRKATPGRRGVPMCGSPVTRMIGACLLPEAPSVTRSNCVIESESSSRSTAGWNCRWKRLALPMSVTVSTFSAFTCNSVLANVETMCPKSGFPEKH